VVRGLRQCEKRCPGSLERTKGPGQSPGPPGIAQTACQVRAVTFRRAPNDANTFVVGLASDSPEESRFRGSTAEFTLLDAHKYPVARSQARAFLGEDARHRLANDQDIYVAVLNTSGVPPGRYDWQVSLEADGQIIKSYVSNDSAQVLVRGYDPRKLEISDALFQSLEEVPGADGKPALEYVANPFQQVSLRGLSVRESRSDSASSGNRSDERAQFGFLVEVYNLIASKDAGASYEAHYAILPRSTFEERIRPSLDRPGEPPPSIARLAPWAVAQDVSGSHFCQTAEVGAFSIPSHAATGTGGGTVTVAEQNVDYGERHLAVTVDVSAIQVGAYVLVMEVRDRANDAAAQQFVPFVIRSD